MFEASNFDLSYDEVRGVTVPAISLSFAFSRLDRCPDRDFDPAAFAPPEAGFYGNLPRNTLIGPGLATTDVSISKRVAVGQGANLQFRAEVFNLFNRANFAIPSQRTVFTSNGPVGSAGLITSTTTSARQVQLGIKMTF
jgi:hypothetical protein